MSIIILNMLLGPPLFRSALIRAGEARAPFLLMMAPKSSDPPESMVVLEAKDHRPLPLHDGNIRQS
jgi:hypothetical protein